MKPASTLPTALICLAIGCHHTPPVPQAIDPAMAACLPPDSALIAGIDLTAVRASPLYAKAPAAAGAFTAQFGGVSSALVAYAGKELLIVARGRFQSPPPGAVMVAPDLALYGSPEQTAAASARYKSRSPGPTALLAQAESVARGAQVWAAAHGNAPLPLSGNVADLAGILRKADFITLTARTGPGLALELRATAPDTNSARAIEETLRADITLGAAGEARRPDVAAALRSARVDRADRQVVVSLSVSEDAAAQLLALFYSSVLRKRTTAKPNTRRRTPPGPPSAAIGHCSSVTQRSRCGCERRSQASAMRCNLTLAAPFPRSRFLPPYAPGMPIA